MIRGIAPLKKQKARPLLFYPLKTIAFLAMLNIITYCQVAPPETNAAKDFTFDANVVTSGENHLATVRQEAGMSVFSTNANLTSSAQNHAKYLSTNNITGHTETQGTSGFTGANPWDRAIAAGYPSAFVSENVAQSEGGIINSIDLLMTAIYHRFGFLSFDYNEVGVGYYTNRYVYNMGNTSMRGICEGPQLSGAGSYYTNLCSTGIYIWQADYNTALNDVSTLQPDLLLWPPNLQTGVLPAFYEESPDPLPDYSVSGYPISVQFNPSFHSAITFVSFRLFRTIDNTEITNTRILTLSTDPNARFSSLEYALFPLDRLDYNTGYRAEFAYVENGINQTVVWSFTSKDLGRTVYALNTSLYTITLPAGSHNIAVYAPPITGFPFITNISYSYSAGMDIQMSFEDPNTILLNISGSAGQKADFYYHADTRIFTVSFN